MSGNCLGTNGGQELDGNISQQSGDSQAMVKLSKADYGSVSEILVGKGNGQQKVCIERS